MVGPVGQHIWSPARHSRQSSTAHAVEHVGWAGQDVRQSPGCSTVHGNWWWNRRCCVARCSGRDILCASAWASNGTSDEIAQFDSIDPSQAVYTVFLSLGSLFGGTCGSYIVAAGGIPWVHWVNVILSAVIFVLCLVLQAETLYDRPQTVVQLSQDRQKAKVDTKEVVVIADSPTLSPSYPPYSYMRSLKLITYRPGIVQKFIAPYKTLRLPGVWLVSLWYAGLVGLIVTLSTIGTQLVAVPPYLWGKNVGLINVGGLIGAFLGGVSILTFSLIISLT
jgi:MFS family permease